MSAARRIGGLLLAITAVLWGLPTAALADDVTWSIAPGPVPEGSQRGGSFAWVAQPGQRIDDSVVLTNRTSTSLHLDVGAKDAITTTDGNLDLRLADQPDTGVGAWTVIDPKTVDIPAGGTVTVPFTITVPADAAPGDYSGGIVSTYHAPGTTVAVDNRVASRVDIRVPGAMKVSHTIQDLSVRMPSTWSPSGGSRATITYTLRNTGNTRIYAQERVEVSGPLGLGSRTVQANLPEILPGASIRRTVTVDAHALVHDRVRVSTHAFGVDESPGDARSLETSAWTVPWTQLIVAVLALAVIVALGVRIGRRRTPEREPGAAPGQTASRSSSPASTAGHSSEITEK